MIIYSQEFKRCCSALRRMKDVILVKEPDNYELFEGDYVCFENPYVAIRAEKEYETAEDYRRVLQKVIDKLYYSYCYFVSEEWDGMVEKDGKYYDAHCIAFQDRE